MPVELASPSDDMFASGAQVLVCPVNCRGVMGKGLALEFRRRYPVCYPPYRRACEDGRMTPGRILLVHCHDIFVAHVPTKRDWRDPSKLGDVIVGIEALAFEAVRCRWDTLAVPALGCGLGQLSFEPVHEALENAFKDLSTNVTIYPPRS